MTHPQNQEQKYSSVLIFVCIGWVEWYLALLVERTNNPKSTRGCRLHNFFERHIVHVAGRHVALSVKGHLALARNLFFLGFGRDMHCGTQAR